MGRLLSLTNVTTNTTFANGATYNAASQLTGLNYGPSLGWAETRTYNTLGQMTRITVPTVMDMEYTFHATQNNGRITKQKDWISGEEVNYTYDSLQRLLTASTTSTAWGLSFGYDGFGNKLSQTVTKGSAPAMNVTVDPLTNRLIGSTYDANGNLTVGSGMTLTHDISNRIATAAGPSAEWYGYAPGNKRVWKKRQTGGSTYEENVYFYAASGQRFGTYTLTDTSGTLALTVKSTNVYFGGKLVKEGTTWVAMDRLASVRARHDGTTLNTFDHFPFGEEKPSTTTQDRNKFATYFRDHTNLDYADQRYYTSGMGRFMTPDPLGASFNVHAPLTANRYSYVDGDPINSIDPRGLAPCGSTWQEITIGGTKLFSITVFDCLILGGSAGGQEEYRARAPMQEMYESGGCMTWYGLNCNDEFLVTLNLLPSIQTVLDIAGFIPYAGEVADIANALLYAAQLDGANAVLSLAGLLPVGGQAATGARVFRNQWQ
jgi:RHS repeat-associated protein